MIYDVRCSMFDVRLNVNAGGGGSVEVGISAVMMVRWWIGEDGAHARNGLGGQGR